MINLRKTVFAILGVVAIVLGIMCFTKDTGDYESNRSYGGDAYTGIQNAAAETARNIKDLAIICSFGFGSVLCVTGGTLLAVAFTNQTVEIANETKTHAKLETGVATTEKTEN